MNNHLVLLMSHKKPYHFISRSFDVQALCLDDLIDECVLIRCPSVLMRLAVFLKQLNTNIKMENGQRS